MNTGERIKLVVSKINEWFSPRNGSLEGAIERTVDEGLFPLVDVRYAVDALKERIREQSLREWAEKAKVPEEGFPEQKVLCLHAGNLPLVGFQDVVACLVSGVQYFGKVSRKDPHLISSFVRQFKDTSLSEQLYKETRLESYENLNADSVIFSGSKKSVPGIKSVIQKSNIARHNSRYLIRTAYFSMAYVDKLNNRIGRDLASAILRYNGKGCRSVAVVVSPLSLSEVKETLAHFLESYWTINPTWREPSPVNRYRFAYNEAVEKDQMLLEHLIIEEGDPSMDNDDVVYWVKGDLDTVKDMADNFGPALQNIYVTEKRKVTGHEDKIEALENAQRPHLNWKPDGVDILEWLCADFTTGGVHVI